jgi:hypothetical protein
MLRKKMVDDDKQAVGLRALARAAYSGTGVTASSGLFFCAHIETIAANPRQKIPPRFPLTSSYTQ